MSDSAMKTAQLDFQVRTIMGPKYKYARIPMNNHASASAFVTATSTELLEWKLPVQVYNLSRSYISYSLEVPALAGKATHRVATFEDTFDIAQSATFGSAGGIDIVNIQHLQNYTKIARKIATSVDDYLGNDDMSQLYRCGDLAGANVLPFKYLGGDIDDANPFGTPINAPKDDYVETKYLAFGEANKTGYRHRQIPLGAIQGTLFAVDRDFYSPVEQYLRLTVGVGNKIAFLTSSSSVPDAGEPLPADKVTINQCYLYLAVEQNQAVTNYIISQYASGQMRYAIPYTTGFKNTGSQNAGDQTNIQIQISQQYGKRLKRILHTVWNNTESLNTAYDCSNWDGSKIATYQTFLDSLPLQDRILSCYRPAGKVVGSDDWFENKKYLDKRSCILSKEMYALNWFHIDQWHEPHGKNTLPDVNSDEGLIMDTPKSWTISSKAGAGNLVHYTWVEFMREIEITVAGPGFV